MKLQRNTDEIKSIVEKLGDITEPAPGMLRGQLLTIYNLGDGKYRILAHRDSGGLSWGGYWFTKEPAIEELEIMTTDMDTYQLTSLRAAGTHFYYGDKEDNVFFKLGIVTLTMDAPVQDILDEPSLPREDYPWGKPPKLTPVLTKQLIRENALTPDTRKHYNELIAVLKKGMTVTKSWERCKDTLHFRIPHDLPSIPEVDRRLFCTLLREEFKEVTDSVVIAQNHISLDVYF